MAYLLIAIIRISSLFSKCHNSIIGSALTKLQEMEKRVAAAPSKRCGLGWNFMQFCKHTFNWLSYMKTHNRLTTYASQMCSLSSQAKRMSSQAHFSQPVMDYNMWSKENSALYGIGCYLSLPLNLSIISD